MEIKLENDILEVTINSKGAELSSITGKETAVQYLWDADEKYWKRSAPVLFPFVGSLKGKNIYTMAENIQWDSMDLPVTWSLKSNHRKTMKHGFCSAQIWKHL